MSFYIWLEYKKYYDFLILGKGIVNIYLEDVLLFKVNNS